MFQNDDFLFCKMQLKKGYNLFNFGNIFCNVCKFAECPRSPPPRGAASRRRRRSRRAAPRAARRRRGPPIAPSGAFGECLADLRENNEGSRAEVRDRFFRSCDGDRFAPPERKSQNDSSGNLSSILSPPAASLLPEPSSFPLFCCTDQLAWPSCEWFENITNI